MKSAAAFLVACIIVAGTLISFALLAAMSKNRQASQAVVLDPEFQQSSLPTPEFRTRASSLFCEFDESPPGAAHRKYRGRYIAVTGIITSINPRNDSLYLHVSFEPHYVISCEFPKTRSRDMDDFDLRETVTVVGKCNGRFSEVLTHGILLTDCRFSR